MQTVSKNGAIPKANKSNESKVISECDTKLCVSTTSVSKNEVTPGANIHTPITHQPYYRGERQLFGYDPLFQPSTVSFDRFNRPYIRTTETTTPVIQTLCSNGAWVESDFLKALPTEFNNCQIMTGSFQEERVVFDKDGDVYTLAHVIKPRYTFFLFHSSDRGVSWKSYELPFYERADSLTFEYTGIDGNYVGVPLIFARADGDKLSIINFTKSENNTLNKPDIFVYGTEGAYNIGLHSGPPNPGVRVGNKVHVVWAFIQQNAIATGTKVKQYATTVDLVTKEILPVIYLGAGPGDDNNDVHNVPSIVYDGEKLHVVLAAHPGQFQYLQSTIPNSTRSWTPPVKIGRALDPRLYGGYTYVGLVIDRDKTLHLVCRFADEHYVFKLVYMRKLINQNWSDHKELVVPFKAYYGVWYHKVSIDRNNRIFVSYKYYGDQMTQKAVDVYHERWPDFPKLIKNKLISGIMIPNSLIPSANYDPNDPMYSWKNIKPHDPVILISDDNGDSFRVATTQDFIKGFKGPESERTADINKDGKVDAGDLALVLTNWGKCDANCEADIDRDGRVGLSDLSNVLVNFGK